jgi:hypothetical protein
MKKTRNLEDVFLQVIGKDIIRKYGLVKSKEGEVYGLELIAKKCIDGKDNLYFDFKLIK